MMIQTADNESNASKQQKRVALHQNNDAGCKKTVRRTEHIRFNRNRLKVRTQRM